MRWSTDLYGLMVVRPIKITWLPVTAPGECIWHS